MKLNKVKIARLTDDQAKSINGGGTNGSTRKNFTCCWCSLGDEITNLIGCPSTQETDGLCNPTAPSPTIKGLHEEYLLNKG